MRAILGGLAALAISTNAWSADMLRGSAPAFGEARSYSWAGVYFGAQGGYGHGDFAFDDSANDLIDALRSQQRVIISSAPPLPDSNGRAASFGGFVGYNSQWGDIVLGAELNYNHTSLTATGQSANPFRTGVTITDALGVVTAGVGNVRTETRAHLTDYGTLRLRAGYAYNWFMPYAMVGVAAGSADVTRSITVENAPPDVAPAGLPVTQSQTKEGAISIGYMAGLGVDIGLMPGVFLRAEYEFIQFGGFDDVPARVNTGRLALGVKF